MKIEEIREKLKSSKYEFEERDIPAGVQFKVENGTVINAYTKGTYIFQGKNIDEIKSLIENETHKNSRKVFVVYGHDDMAKIQLEALLRRWDLEPIILDQQATAGQTIIEKLEECIDSVNFGIVLATPDDWGKAKTYSGKYKGRVRQNVVLELGMLLSKLGRDKVAILLKEDSNFEKPSDIQGLIYIPFSNKIEECGMNLIRELSKQNIKIESDKL